MGDCSQQSKFVLGLTPHDTHSNQRGRSTDKPAGCNEWMKLSADTTAASVSDPTHPHAWQKTWEIKKGGGGGGRA